MDNKQIRVVMRDNNIYMWQVAKKLNVNETSFCKWFREELSEERKQQDRYEESRVHYIR